MRKIKEVLRLKYEVGLGQRQIARGCSIGLGTVNDYLARAERAGIRWPLPEGWEEPEVEAALFGREPAQVVRVVGEAGRRDPPADAHRPW